jgi:hypothetical protein
VFEQVLRGLRAENHPALLTCPVALAGGGAEPCKRALTRTLF